MACSLASRSSYSTFGPAILLCDNKSAIFMSQNPSSHKHSEHIDLDYHFVREQVATGALSVSHIPSHLQIIDVFTKSLSRPFLGPA